MHWVWVWVSVLLGLGVADLAIRLGTGFDMVWVVRMEGPLFLASSLMLLLHHRRRPAHRRWQRGLQVGLVVALALAGLRAVLWAAGLPVQWANIAGVAAAFVGGAALLWRGHRARDAARRPHAADDLETSAAPRGRSIAGSHRES